MTREDVVREFGAERLARHNFFERDATRPREVGILLRGGTWVVYMTDERGGDAGTRVFDNEDAALARFSALLRYFERSGRESAW
jgi:hypothetical protein